jgi:hypothetical protein
LLNARHASEQFNSLRKNSHSNIFYGSSSSSSFDETSGGFYFSSGGDSSNSYRHGGDNDAASGFSLNPFIYLSTVFDWVWTVGVNVVTMTSPACFADWVHALMFFGIGLLLIISNFKLKIVI